MFGSMGGMEIMEAGRRGGMGEWMGEWMDGMDECMNEWMRLVNDWID
jgi:hypothetical protein